MSLQVRAVHNSESGALLTQVLQERGLIGENPNGVVSYGVKEKFLGDYSSLPVLNRNAGKYDKFEALDKMSAAGVPVPFFSKTPDDMTFPLFGRRLKHSRGKDIIPLLAKDQTFEFIKNSGLCDFYTTFIPTQKEYRVWVYRRQHLATYEKYFTPQEQVRGLSFDLGFRYLENPPDLEAMCGAAVQALELDFGAVDVIHGQDGRFYVLEVNTAPWAQTRLRGIVRLANKIVRWHELGFPRRRGEA